MKAAPRVLLTRPTGSNDALAALLQASGVETRSVPLLEICDLPLSSPGKGCLIDLDNYALVIVTSQHAARRLVEEADQWWPQWPVGIRWWAIGKATARVLEEAGLRVKTPASGSTSEDLLAEPDLESPEGQRVLLAAGEGGRDTLAAQLSARGALVDRLSLYRREPAAGAETALKDTLLHWKPDLIQTLSGETLRELLRVGHNTGHSFKNTALLVPSERVGEIARQETEYVHVLPDMSPEGQHNAILQALSRQTSTRWNPR